MQKQQISYTNFNFGEEEKRNCYINWSQLYNFVTKDYGLTKIDIITKNVLDEF